MPKNKAKHTSQGSSVNNTDISTKSNKNEMKQETQVSKPNQKNARNIKG